MRAIARLVPILPLLLLLPGRASASSKWMPTGQLTGSGVCSLVASSDGSAIWAGTFGYGLYRSADGGSHWVRRPGPNDSAGSCPVVLPDASDGRTAVVVTDSAYVTHDGGATWQANSVPAAPAALMRPQSGNGSVVIAATDPGPIFRSTDASLHWQSVALPVHDSIAAIQPVAPGRVLVSFSHEGVWWLSA